MASPVHFSPLLRDALDSHLHGAPSVYDRELTIGEIAVDAEKAGMAGILDKAHEMQTVALGEELTRILNFPVYGTIVLNHEVGGLNEAAVEVAIKLGTRSVHLPTTSSHAHVKPPGLFAGNDGKIQLPDISLMDADGNLRPELLGILDLVAAAGIALITGHTAPDELEPLVHEAIRRGIKPGKILIQHACMHIAQVPLEMQLRLVKLGCKVEMCALATNRGNFPHAGTDAKYHAEQIRILGAENVILSSDGGQAGNGHPLVTFGRFLEDLVYAGIPEDDVRMMSSRNPKKLLGLIDA